MTVYAQIGEITEIDRQSTPSSNLIYTTNSNFFNNANVRSGIQVYGGPAQKDSDTWFAGPAFSSTDLWTHFVLYIDYANNAVTSPLIDTSMIRIMAGGTQRLRLVPYSDSILKLEKWTGAAWTVLGTYNHNPLLGVLTRTKLTIDIHATIGASANIVVYMNNTIIITATGVDTTFGGTVTAFDDVIFSQPNFTTSFGTSWVVFSEIILADFNTIGSKVVVRIPDANGNYTEWTNANYTVVDEIYGGTDYATSPTANQRVDWSLSNFPTAGANEIIPSVKLTATLNRDLSGPQAANFYIRRGSTDYDNTDMSLQTTQHSESKTYTTDPATGDVWTVANLNAATFGIRSRP